MKPKIKPCTECDNGKEVIIYFSKGTQGANPVHLCKMHNEMRKRNTAQAPVRTTKRPRQPTGEYALFQAIWAVRPHKSVVSGLPLHFNVSIFAHVLSKKQFPNYRLTDKNIQLLTPLEHHLWDQGTEEQRQKYAKVHNADWSILHKISDELRTLAQKNSNAKED
jgi:hypothetical protein